MLSPPIKAHQNTGRPSQEVRARSICWLRIQPCADARLFHTSPSAKRPWPIPKVGWDFMIYAAGAVNECRRDRYLSDFSPPPCTYPAAALRVRCICHSSYSHHGRESRRPQGAQEADEQGQWARDVSCCLGKHESLPGHGVLTRPPAISTSLSLALGLQVSVLPSA